MTSQEREKTMKMNKTQRSWNDQKSAIINFLSRFFPSSKLNGNYLTFWLLEIMTCACCSLCLNQELIFFCFIIGQLIIKSENKRKRKWDKSDLSNLLLYWIAVSFQIKKSSCCWKLWFLCFVWLKLKTMSEGESLK